MLNILLRLLGERALHKAAANGAHHNPLDVKFGIALLRDRRVPIKSKLLAFGMGVGLMALLVALQVPLEAIVTFLAPILLPLDFVLDGVEMIALPVLFTAILIAYAAPRVIVDRIRAERSFVPMAHPAHTEQEGMVIEVPSYDPRAVPITLPQTPIYAGSRRV